MPDDLSGVGVLVTRPKDQAENLSLLIEQAGGTAIRLPLLEIVEFDEDCQGVCRLKQLEDWDWLIFVSSNAVRCAFKWLNLAKSGVKIAAIGKATADALASLGIQVDLAPIRQFNSEALLAMPALQQVEGQRFLIVRGEGGLDTLYQTLTSRGAKVAYAELYKRVMPKMDFEGLIARWKSFSLRIAIITSGEALDNLAGLLAESALLNTTPLVVIGERLTAKARDLGCVQVKMAEACDIAIFDSVMSVAREYQTIPMAGIKH